MRKKAEIAVVSIIFLVLWWAHCAAAPKDGFVNDLGMKFVYIPPGTFVMGSPETEARRKDDETPHKVTLSAGWYMQTTEVTQGQWQAVMGSNPSAFAECGENCPVENVSWIDVQNFIAKLNALDRRSQYRLPTEAEWEYACRAGKKTRYFWGDETDCRKANFANSPLADECKGVSPGKPSPVGAYPANPWGLHDMHGNVWEWCADWYGEYGSAAVTDPKGPPNGVNRTLRGGAYFDPAASCRTANRCWDPADYRVQDIGFRLVRLPIR
ncbi:MAG: hypothetical protein CSB33_05020 [Desulfobacterales bacterium]|nr:MAG: hypothetical protein CSB33_05020 [Desulfobacterales bacterium]